MKIRGRVKPSKPISAVAMIMGIVFVGIGVFVVIPSAGPFGVLWTLAALFIAGYHAYNLFSESGASHAVVDIDAPAPRRGEQLFFEDHRRGHGNDQVRRDFRDLLQEFR